MLTLVPVPMMKKSMLYVFGVGQMIIIIQTFDFCVIAHLVNQAIIKHLSRVHALLPKYMFYVIPTILYGVGASFVC